MATHYCVIGVSGCYVIYAFQIKDVSCLSSRHLSSPPFDSVCSKIHLLPYYTRDISSTPLYEYTSNRTQPWPAPAPLPCLLRRLPPPRLGEARCRAGLPNVEDRTRRWTIGRPIPDRRARTSLWVTKRPCVSGYGSTSYDCLACRLRNRQCLPDTSGRMSHPPSPNAT